MFRKLLRKLRELFGIERENIKDKMTLVLSSGKKRIVIK